MLQPVGSDTQVMRLVAWHQQIKLTKIPTGHPGSNPPSTLRDTGCPFLCSKPLFTLMQETTIPTCRSISLY